MNINSQNLSFKSQIKFVDNKTFNKLPLTSLKAEGMYLPYKQKEGEYKKEITKANEAYTDCIACCTAGGITDSKDVTLFHFIPGNSRIEGFQKIEEEMQEKSGVTKETGDKLNGLIIGGFSEKLRKKGAPKVGELINCKKIFDKVKGVFEKNNISPSIIWGHKLDYIDTDICYSAKQDTWFITTNEYPAKDLKILKGAYEIIKFSEKDKADGIWINNKKLSSKEVSELEQGHDKL